MNEFSDEKLFKLFQEGDNKALDQLVIRYKDRLYNFIYRIVNDVDLAEDLTQDTYYKIFINKDSYKELYKFSTWMYTIAKNLAFTELRKKKRRKTYAVSDLSTKDREFVLSSDTNVIKDSSVESNDLSLVMNTCLKQLSDEFKTMIIFRDFQELSYDVISKIMEIPIGTVKSRINRGREKLYQLLKGKEII